MHLELGKRSDKSVSKKDSKKLENKDPPPPPPSPLTLKINETEHKCWKQTPNSEQIKRI